MDRRRSAPALFRSRLEAQHPGRVTHACIVVGMVHAVHHGNFHEVKRAHPFEAGDIDAIFVWHGAGLVKAVDAAVRAEMVLSHAAVETVNSEGIRTLRHCQIRKSRISGDSTFHGANRAIAARSVQVIGQGNREVNGPAVAGPVIEARGIVHLH